MNGVLSGGMASRRQVRDQQRRQRIISVFLSLLMIVSIAGVYFSYQVDDGSFAYEGYTFRPTAQGTLLTTAGDEDVEFYTAPEYARRFEPPAGFVDAVRAAGQLAVTYAPDDVNAQYIDLLR
ncbi:MAG: hypothetical protein HC945_03760, partial [Nitrosarchaeum sp.]|nr:hypothetical protein [Nitrosarchaeum sp.]